MDNEFNVEIILKMGGRWGRKWRGRILKNFDSGKSERERGGVFGRLVAERSEGKCDKP